MLSQRNKKWVSLLTVLSLWVSMVLPNTVVLAADESSATASIPGLVGEWKFEDMTGSVTPDTFMHNDAVVSKAALGSGKFGKALLLNGYDSYATIPNNNLINTGSDFSMSMLVNFNSTYTNRTVVLLQQQGTDTTMLLKRRPDGRLESALGGAATIGATPIEPKKWYHVALVREGGTVKLYVNGALDIATANTHMDSNTGEIRLGADTFPDSSNAWPGYIDEVQVYDRALTDKQMQQAPGLVWPAITLSGSADMTLSTNEAYVEAGATATDAVDGDLTASIQKTGNVDTSKGGIYTIKYTVSSSRGDSSTKVRIVKVVPPKTLSRASRVLIDRGLQMQTWMRAIEQEGASFATPEEWKGSNFTTATYYEWPFYNTSFHKALPDAQWSLKKDLGGSPTDADKKGFLSSEQAANVNNLITISFGDEESYSEDVLKTFTDWFKLSHQLYPNVLAHSNQQSRQWQRDSFETYIKTAEPDLLTFDDYMFSTLGTDKNLFTTVLNNINDQRTIALGGFDRTGQSPIAFGQYLLGFKTGKEPADVGPYIITESQVYGIPFATLTLGGKWLSMFRWEYDSRYFLFFDKDRKPTPQYYQYAEMARQIKNLGPHLVRLNSTDVFTVPGQYKDESGAIQNNKTPRETPVLNKYNRLTHPYLRSMTVKNNGTENNGLNGDALIGFFDPLPGTQSFFGSADMEYFMVMNGLTTGNGLLPDKQHGSGADTKQTITVELNLAKYTPDAIKRVSRDTGKLEAVALKSLGGNRYQLNVTLNGGVADLFQLDKTKVNPNYVAAESVSLPATLSMIPGDTMAAIAVVSPVNASEKGVEWSSSNENIAKVDANGNVTAVAGGNAFITATTVDGSKMAKIAVSVASVTMPVTGITVSPVVATLYTEDSMKLTAVVMPNNATNKAYVWSSSDERIAKLDQSGIVTAVSPGSAAITATTVDGSFKGTSSITVLDASSEAALSELTVNGGSSDLAFNSTTFDYSITLDASIDTLTLQPRLKNSKGTMKVNGTSVNSGELITAKVPMGNSKIVFVTQAADGIASKTYTVTVKRNKNIALEASVVATYKNHGQEWSADDYVSNPEITDKDHLPLQMIDGNVNTYFQSASMPVLNAKGEFEPPHRILLQWNKNNLQDFNKLVLVVNKAQQQGLKVLDISTTEDGENWEETKSSVYLTWGTDSPDIYERVTINLPDYKAIYEKEGHAYKGLKGIYLSLWAANLDNTNRYAISEFELYNEQDATEPVKLTVSDIPVTGVQVNPASVDLLIHDTAKLTAVFAPANASNQTVQWSSSDERVATVNGNGIVTAISVGTAIITATAREGSPLTASSTIQVTNPSSDASLSALLVNDGSTNIAFNSSKLDYSLNIDPSVDTITLKPTLKKADSTMKINGSAVKAGQWVTAKVPMGNSQIRIVVTANDGATIKTYTITLKRNKNIALEAKAARATFTEHGQEWNINTNDYNLESEHSPLKMIDGSVNTYFQSASIEELNPKGEFNPAHKILLEWDEKNLQDFNKLVLVVNKAQQQGLKVLDISTTEDGVNWEETNSSNYLTWQTDSEDEYERVTINLIDYKAHYGAKYKGLRGIYLLLWAANLNEDKRYAISEFELYNEKDATEPVQITVNSPITPPDTGNPPVTPVTPPTTSVEKGSIHLGVPKVDAATGEAKAVVSNSDWSKAIETASADANGVKAVKIDVPKADGTKNYVVELPQAALASSEAKTKIELSTEYGTIAAWANMLSGMDLTGAKSVALSIATADISSLDPAVKAQIGNRPVIELNVKIDGKTVAWSNPKAPVQISIPYKPSAEELADPEHIVVWYIDNAGKAVPVVNGKYDPIAGTVTFKTSHFSKYAIVFVHKTFNDIHLLTWANKQIEVMASRGVINGTSASTFAPAETITRADFTALLVRALELTADGSKANFSDVAASAYYYNEVAIAKKLGIASGSGDGKFNPLQPISRQDALVLLHKAMKVAGKSIVDGSASDLDRFLDKGEIATYASDRIAALVHSGIIKGDGVSFHPLATLTRAEAAVMLYNMFNKE
ncbi:hypothetical protein Back11_40920 [Paenibacillus baekrokdamisoli]|uniref:Uncharacterized protein n=1 Tax=Paenibacillus baekrokdamisoli TaxID=1712516 RepID=A0A3G9IV95_9BACL|nr:Ig-like domain-containing protein [Paenibacillus baekrokdamisoli]MBB3068210.1 uncharacterized protein YjdB [Paenibacillus baekrokdamisoli]BBH22747.1 hypothetical protein Back11_40920 [Paenibacillus baekrokdamisoli]